MFIRGVTSWQWSCTPKEELSSQRWLGWSDAFKILMGNVSLVFCVLTQSSSYLAQDMTEIHERVIFLLFHMITLLIQVHLFTLSLDRL